MPNSINLGQTMLMQCVWSEGGWYFTTCGDWWNAQLFAISEKCYWNMMKLYFGQLRQQVDWCHPQLRALNRFWDTGSETLNFKYFAQSEGGYTALLLASMQSKQLPLSNPSSNINEKWKSHQCHTIGERWIHACHRTPNLIWWPWPPEAEFGAMSPPPPATAGLLVQSTNVTVTDEWYRCLTAEHPTDMTTKARP